MCFEVDLELQTTKQLLRVKDEKVLLQDEVIVTMTREQRLTDSRLAEARSNFEALSKYTATLKKKLSASRYWTVIWVIVGVTVGAGMTYLIMR